MKAGRPYMSIGEVLGVLQPDFPDVTVSKIRFLESEGLIDPERTASGYRKFYQRDLDRLRFILTLQRDSYLPLKVIRDRLAEFDAGLISNANAVAGNGDATASAEQRSGVAAPGTAARAPRPGLCLRGPARLPCSSLSASNYQLPNVRLYNARSSHTRSGVIWRIC